MPDMNTSHTFTMPEAYKYKQYINGLWVNEYLASDPIRAYLAQVKSWLTKMSQFLHHMWLNLKWGITILYIDSTNYFAIYKLY